MEIVKLNVGGKKFATLKSTLLKYKNSYFADLINNNEKVIYDENNAIFIDRNPKHFEFVIEYLRTGFMESLPHDFDSLKRLNDEVLYYKLVDLSQEMYFKHFPSAILTQDLVPISVLFKMSDFFIKKWQLVYRGSRDGFEPKNFHEKCDVLKNSLVIAKTTKNFVFGGYTNASWASSSSPQPSAQPSTPPILDGNRLRKISVGSLSSLGSLGESKTENKVADFKRDPDAFIFSIMNCLNKEFLMKCINSDKAIYADPRCGPVFGSNEFNLLDMSSYLAYEGNSKIDKLIPRLKNYSKVGENYQLPEEISNVHFLADAKSFDLAELEVFTTSFL